MECREKETSKYVEEGTKRKGVEYPICSALFTELMLLRLSCMPLTFIIDEKIENQSLSNLPMDTAPRH